jgi:regulator of sigma D|tara:strand:- start:2431 stop:2889 length:459 start_codon:yes stop_codon:yes gene_type:complete
MLEQLEKTQEKYGGSKDAIDRWLEERQELLIRYCQLSGLKKFKKSRAPEPEQISRFCEVLVDYVSAGHFEIYEDIVSKCSEHGPDSVALAKRLLPKITETTELAIDFNDRYESEVEDEQWGTFDQDLSELGECLATRIELEDKLIHTLHEKH